MLDTLDNGNFKLMTSALMEASRCAGKAGLEEYLSQHDTIKPTIEKNGSVLRYKGTSSKELLTLFGTIRISGPKNCFCSCNPLNYNPLNCFNERGPSCGHFPSGIGTVSVRSAGFMTECMIRPRERVLVTCTSPLLA